MKKINTDKEEGQIRNLNEEILQRHNNYMKDYISDIRESDLQYCLEKTIECKTLQEYRELLKQEITNIHKKNMKNLDFKINHE